MGDAAAFHGSVLLLGTQAMKTTEAQRRASAAYQSRSVTQICIKFSPKDKQLYEWIKSRGPSASGYLKSLARTEMQRKQQGSRSDGETVAST